MENPSSVFLDVIDMLSKFLTRLKLDPNAKPPLNYEAVMNELAYAIADAESPMHPIRPGFANVIYFENLRSLYRYMCRVHFAIENGLEIDTVRIPLRLYPLKKMHHFERVTIVIRITDFLDYPHVKGVFIQSKKLTEIRTGNSYKRILSQMRSRNCHNCKRNDSLQKTKRMHCGRCRKVHYCSKACQINDWDNHKMYCNV